jgi:hypothetical protein
MIVVTVSGPLGDGRFTRSIEHLAENTREGIRRSWFFIANDIRDEFNRQVLSRNKSGRLYIGRDRLGRRRPHRASAPGETPANRTGTYRKSLDARISRDLTMGLSAPYSGYLEGGTPRMEARPGLRNSIQAKERDTLNTLARGIQRQL